MNLFRFDLKNAIRSNVPLLVLSIVVVILGCLFLRGKADDYEDYVKRQTKAQGEAVTEIKAGGNDYILFLFRGMKAIAENEQGNADKVKVPEMYLAFMVIFTVMGEKYLFSQMSEFTFFRVRKKRHWIASKICCNILGIVFVYSFGMFVAVIFGRGFGGNESIDKGLMGVDFCRIDSVGRMLILLATAVLTTATIMLVQLAIALIFGNIAGVLSSIAIYIFSLFYNTPWLIGNGLMLQRSEYFLNGGYSILQVVGIDILFCIISYIAIELSIRKYEILK